MPARLNTQTRVVQGNRAIVVGNDDGWRFGPVEGHWYIGMFIFAVIVLMYNLAWPWVYETAMGSSWRFRNGPVAVSRQQPVIVRPVVVVQPAPPPVRSAPSSGEPTAEELDRRHSQYLRSRGQ